MKQEVSTAAGKNQRTKIDMLNGPLWNKIPQFALPVAATAVLGQLFNASDLAIIGNFTGDIRTVAVAAVGANSAVISLVLNFFVGIALGVNVVIANAIGRNDREEVQRVVHTAVIVAVIGGILVAVLGQLAAGRLLGTLHVPDEVFPYALLYLRIYLLGMPVMLLYNFEAAIFRSVGDTKVPLAALAFSGVLNVFLNLFFVTVLKMTVDGVAVATVISNAVSAVLLFHRLLKTEQVIRLELHCLRVDTTYLKKILRIGLPAGTQSAVFSISNIVIQSAVNSLGTVVMAASSAAYNIEIIAYFVLNSFAQACTTFVGQNYGARQKKRCQRTLLICIAEDAIACGTAVALVLFFGKSLLALFNNDPQVISIGYTRMVIVLASYLFSMLYEMMSGYMRGFGISLTPALLTIFGVCVVRITWIRLVFPVYRTFETIMIAYPVSLSITALLIFAALLICRPSRRLDDE